MFAQVLYVKEYMLYGFLTKYFEAFLPAKKYWIQQLNH